MQQQRRPSACLGSIPSCRLFPSLRQVVPTFSASRCSSAVASVDRELFVVGSWADNEVESQALLTVAWENFDKVPSWLEASAFVHSCTPDSWASSCCSRCNRKDRRDKLGKVDSCLDVGESVDAVDNSRTNVDCIRALSASQKPFQVDGIVVGFYCIHLSRHSLDSCWCRKAFDFAVECLD